MRIEPAWKKFLSTLMWSVAAAGGFFLIVGLAMAFTQGNPNHTEFAKQCAIENGSVRKLNGVAFCVHIRPAADVIWLDASSASEKLETTKACMQAGGIIYDFSSNTFDKGCYKITIVEELGARDDYVIDN